MTVTLFNNTQSPDTINRNILGSKRTAIYDEAQNALVAFDAVISEDHNFTSKISDHPAEDGIDFSDMQRDDPITLTLSIIQSNNPLETFELSDVAQLGAGLGAGLVSKFVPQSIKDAAAGITRPIGADNPLLAQARGLALGATLGVVTAFLSPEDRNDIAASNALRAAKTNSTRLIIVTPFVQYTNMFLQNISITKNKTSQHSLVANLQFREIQIYKTNTKRFEANGISDEINDKKSNKLKKGSKQLKESSEATTKKANDTWLRSGIRAVFGK